MTTERMTEILNSLGRYVSDMQSAPPQPEEVQSMAALIRDVRRVEQEQAEKIRKLETMLRLANDKMAEQVRQARWEVADDIVNAWLDPSYKTGDDLVAVAKRIRDANAPKD